MPICQWLEWLKGEPHFLQVMWHLQLVEIVWQCLNWKIHFSHPFLGTYEVHQFLDLGYLEGTHSGVVNELHTNTTLIPIPCYIPYHTIPYYTTSYHTIRGVWGPFTKYEKYFYRLQYLSVGLHLLWTGSSDFCHHFKLQVEVIGWVWSFENQLNWALSQVLAIYTLDNPSQAT